MSTSLDLLDRGDELLAKGSRSSNRIACWLGRRALEDIVDDLLELRQRHPGESSMASRLTCLEIAYAGQPDVVETAEYAWAGLSQASHQHAFQLDPTATECRHLISLVRRLADRLSEAGLSSALK